MFSGRAQSQFILMVGDDGVLMVPYGLPDSQIFFAPHGDEKARDMVMALLGRRPAAPVTLFADMLAQDFRSETLPRLSFLDRPKLVRRRLQQAFPQARLTAALNSSQGRTHILMAGLQSGSPLFEWMDRLRTRLPRICLVPIEGAAIATRIFPDARNGWAMTVSRERTGGFRQIVTHGGELIFTRLTPPVPETAMADEIAEALQRDITASLGYLSRLGLTDAGKLHIALLMPDAIHDMLAEMPLPVHSLTLLSPRKLALHLRLPFTPYATDPYSDLIYAGWLAQQSKPRLILRTPEIRESFWHRQIRRAGTRAAMAAMALALLTTGVKASDLFLTVMQTHRETTRLEALKQELAATQAEAAPLTGPLGKLREAFERQRLFKETGPMPWTALAGLGQGLGDNVRLIKLDWQNDSGRPDSEILQIEARLNDMPPDREQAATRFRLLTNAIAHRMPAYTVTLTRAPFPVAPQEAVSNMDDKNPPDTAELTIRRAP